MHNQGKGLSTLYLHYIPHSKHIFSIHPLLRDGIWTLRGRGWMMMCLGWIAQEITFIQFNSQNLSRCKASMMSFWNEWWKYYRHFLCTRSLIELGNFHWNDHNTIHSGFLGYEEISNWWYVWGVKFGFYKFSIIRAKAVSFWHNL